MAIIYSYPQGTPTLTDNVIGSQIDPITEENKTVQFTIGSIATLIGSGGGGTGTVTTVSATIAGNAFDVAVTNPTTAPALGFTWAGTAAQYITGQGNLSTSLVIGTTSTTAMAGNTTTITSGQASAITANTAKVTFPGFGTTSSTALAGNTTIITSGQASEITANTAKVSDTGIPAILTNGGNPGTITLSANVVATDVRTAIGAGDLTKVEPGDGMLVDNPNGPIPIVKVRYDGLGNFINSCPNLATTIVDLDDLLFQSYDIAASNRQIKKIKAEDLGLAELTKTITAAELNALNGTDITLIPANAQGGIKILDASFSFNYVSPQFAFNNDLTGDINNVNFFTVPSVNLEGTNSIVGSMQINGGVLADNTALLLRTAGAVTSSGGGSLKIKIRYQILNPNAF